MGIHFELVDFEHEFHQLRTPPTMLNDYVALTEDQKDALANLTTTSYDNEDVFANDPACACGQTRGAYRLGHMCPNCSTPVVDMFGGVIESRVWMRAPNKVRPLVNPEVWIMLKRMLMKNGVSVLEWLTNTDYVATECVREMEVLQEAGFRRGYNHFIENFHAILDTLIQARIPSTSKKIAEIKAVAEAYAASVFSVYLPLPNKTLLVIEKTPMAQYVEDVATQLLEVIRMMTGIDRAIPVLNQRQLENRTAKALFKYAEYHELVARTQIAKKSGLLRKHVYGGRNNFSVRSVISSRTDPHSYKGIVIGWGHALIALGLHVKNKLMRKHGYSPAEASSLINAHIYRHHPVLEQVLQELFDEAPDKRLKALFVRNPTLTQASVQQLDVVGFKRDPNDPTMSFSILDVKGYNADFDGDQMSLIFSLDEKMSKMLAPLSPHENVMDINAPGGITNVAAMSAPVASTIANYVESERLKPPTPEQISFLKSLAF